MLRVLATTPGGNPIEFYSSPNWRSSVHFHSCLFIAGIHGDERAGPYLLERFLRDIEKNPVYSNVFLGAIAISNPDGFQLNQRENGAGVDINRNFDCLWQFRPGGRHGLSALSELETKTLADLILRLEPHVIVNIHWALSYIEADSPHSGALADRMWHALPKVDKPLYKLLESGPDLTGRPDKNITGSLGMWAGHQLEFKAFRRPKVITLELPYDPFLAETPDKIPENHLKTVEKIWDEKRDAYLDRIYPGFYNIMAECLKP